MPADALVIVEAGDCSAVNRWGAGTDASRYMRVDSNRKSRGAWGATGLRDGSRVARILAETVMEKVVPGTKVSKR
jgi:hypothetical protein